MRFRNAGLAMLLVLLLAGGCQDSDDDTTGDDDTSGDDDTVGDDDTAPVDEDGDGWTVEDGDCDDADPDVHPGVDDVCDGLDNDCDGTVDNTCVTDSFVQEANRDVDILWVVDNGCSMGGEHTILGSSFTVYYDALVDAEMDFRIAVVTTDTAEFQGSPTVIDALTSDPTTVFAASVDVGTTGASPEQGLRYGLEALTRAAADTPPNNDFWRTEASLQVIFVSDEPDQSSDPWEDYLAGYRALKDDPDRVLLHAICGTDGTVADSCAGPNGSASGGEGYVDAVNAYVSDEQPWALAKQAEERPRLATVLYVIAESLRAIAVLYHPTLPKAT